jgi:hypothetical protein
MRRRANWMAMAAVTIMTLGAAVPAQAQKATFSRIDDAVSSRCWNPATTKADPLDANRLIIGFHTGIDSATLKSREFKASSTSFNWDSAADTIAFRITAPSGYYVAKITYSQRGTGSVVRTGKASGNTQIVVNGSAQLMGTFSTNPTLTRTIDLTSQKLRVVPVSITSSLFAFSTVSLGSATVALTGADVRVELAPLP